MSEPNTPQSETPKIPPEVIDAISTKGDEILDRLLGPFAWKPIITAILLAVVPSVIGWLNHSNTVAEVQEVKAVLEKKSVVKTVKVDPAPVHDLAKRIDSGFSDLKGGLSEMSLYLKSLGDKIDAKPKPKPDPTPTPGPTPPSAKLTLPASVQVDVGGTFVKVQASAPTAVSWFWPANDGIKIDQHGDTLYISATRAGEYWVIAYTAAAGKITDMAACKIVAGGSTPGPTPGPTPPPKVDKLSMVLIWESSDVKEWQKGIVNDLAFFRSLEPLGVTWFKLDKDQKDAAAAYLIDAHNYRQFVTKHGLPCLILMDATGLVMQSMPLPDSTAAIREAVKQLTGR